jgi:hypothetical protein
MQRRRFPLRKYLTRIADMESDFRWWQTEYADACERQVNVPIANRYEQRADTLEEARQRLHDLFHELESMPRLS